MIQRLNGQLPGGVELVMSDGNPARLIEAWSNASLAIVVDAVRADPPQPGRHHRFVLDGTGPGTAPDAARTAPGARPTASTHGFGLDAALGISLALGRLPQRLIVYAIEVTDLSQGEGMTAEVAAAVGAAAAAVRRDIMTAQ